MLDIKYIREHKDEVKENAKKRRSNVDIDSLLSIDEKRRELLHFLEDKRASRNAGSKGKPSEEEIAKMKAIGEEIKADEAQLETITKEYESLLMSVPNMTHPDTPEGGEEDYKVLNQKDMSEFSFTPKDHEALLTQADLLDFERGAKVAGAKFYFAKNGLVRLNQALINYGMDVLEKHGFTLFETPDLAKQEVLIGTGFNPRGDEDQIYSIENTDLNLIATAEITVGGYHKDEVLDLSSGPKKYAALSHCFRKEAGAYGRTSKGLYRVHQFTKLEMFVYCKPDESEALHEELLSIEKKICDGLGLSYRVIDIASGDLGGPAYRKFDVEAWMSMKGDETKQGDFGEITSTSNCRDYQARRLNIKYKKEDGTNEFAHTLNGTAIVLSRFPIAIAEQYQKKDGSIMIPEILVPYMGGKTTLN